MKKRIIIIAVVLALAALIAFTLRKNKKEIEAANKVVDRSGIAVPVAVIPAAEAAVKGGFILPAVVQPVDEVNIAINASGKLKTLNIDLGTHVNKGETLGSIDNSLKELNLKSTQILLDKYTADYTRYKELYAGKAATETELNNAKYNYDNTKVQLDQIKQQIADGQVIAPISGTVVKKNVNAGEFVNMGATIGSVVDVAHLKANVMVSEKDVYKLKEHMPVEITSDIYPGKTFKGNVRYISPKGDDSHNYLVEVSIDNSGSTPLKAGTFVRTSFDVVGSGSAMQIPKTTLVEGIKNPYVYVVKDGKATVRKLTLGREIGENVEVLSGLNTGDQVVTSGQINLAEGSLVQIINQK